MQELMNESISVTYHYGARTQLSQSWRDKNIIVPNSKIYYVLSGEIAVETEKDILIAKRGDAILIPAGVKHGYRLTELGEAEKYWAHFDLRRGNASFFENITMPYKTHLGVSSELTSLFEMAVTAETPLTAKNRLTRSYAIVSIIAKYLDSSGFSEAPFKAEDETDNVIKYIKKNYADHFTLEELATMARLSPNYFTKKFKERTGHPPLKYINILKIERAKFLLEHTEMPINSIMEEIGILDAAHFSKLFKTNTGYSPRRFRASFENIK